MVGFRSKESYIKKFGHEEGERRYKTCVERREKRERRKRQESRTVKLSNDPLVDLKEGRAIRCRACGALLTRIQWTHFSSGKCGVDSIKNYRELYPDAPLVAPALAKVTSMTLENMIDAYGDVEGRCKWDEYRKRQAETNTFVYKERVHGFTTEDFEQYNQDRAQTLTAMIRRHGEEEGLTRWNDYVERQRFTTSLEYFVERYGLIDGTEKYTNFCQKRRFQEVNTSRKEDELYALLRSELKDETLKQSVCIDIRVDFGPFDIGSIEKRRLIEFYGTYWHCDPRKYLAEDIHPTRQKPARTIWSRDQAKRTFATNRGYRIFIVWEADYDQDKDQVISSIAEWWKKKD